MNRPGKRSPFKPYVIAAVLVIPALFLLCVAAFHLVPDELIEGRLKEAAGEAGVAFTRKSFGKAFPFGIELRAVEVYGNGGTRLVLLDRVRARINPLSLFAGRLTAYIDGDAGDGGFTGYAILRPSGVGSLAMEARGVDLRYLPVLSRSSVKINGLIDARVSLSKVGSGCPEGTVSIKGYRIESSEVKVMGYPLPLGPIESAGGQVELKGCKALIDGLWIEGKDLSARLRGEITVIRTPLAQSPVELTLEITPRGGLVNKEFMLSLLSGYRKSANFYSIPVKGTIGDPVFAR